MTDVARGRAPRKERPIEYPVSDGKPMAESDRHRDLAYDIIAALKHFFRDRPDVYVSGNNFVYYEEGNPRAVVSPDAYVVFGVPMRQRDCYMAWLEGGRLPDVVFEFTSRKTRREDTHVKRPRYEQVLRVPEYFLFDPRGDYLKPRLQGYRLVGGVYVPLEVVNGRLHSERLRLDLVQDGDVLRLQDPATGELSTNYDELSAGSAELDARAAREAARAQTAEEELARLRAELEALRKRTGDG
jgi:Uma2 family endonuclease